jgi:glycosyltransferase involved in cell wall biosynthesis
MGIHAQSGPDEAPPLLSLVILCYRSGQYVTGFVEETEEVLRAGGIDDYELILVGNYVEGTEDETPAVVQRLAEQNPRVSCSALPKEGWMGWDMRSGLRLCRGEYLGVIDGDGQMPIADIIPVFEKIREGGHDMAMTFRVTRGDGPLRKFFSYGYNVIFRLLFPGVAVRDVNSKPKILTRRAYEAMDLRADDWFIDAEMLLEARRLGLKIGEVPTDFLGLSGRRSFVNLRTVIEFLVNLARYRFPGFGKRKNG